MKDHFKSNHIVQGGTAGSDHFNKTASGLSDGHAYSIMGVVMLSTGEKLVKIRNPWGEEGFKGDWSDKSSKWTAASKREAGHKDANDGYFFMSHTDYQ